MRLLLINPNTTESITARMATAAAAFLPSAHITAATGRFGAAYISSRASYAVAGHAALDALAESGRDADVVLLACFGDPGLDALREVSTAPVVSLIEASCREAAADGRRFSIVTGGERWVAMLTEQVRAHGLARDLASIRAVAPSGGQIASDPQAAYALLADACNRCAREDGASAVILGGAGLIGIADAIRSRVDAELICSVTAGFRAVREAMAAPRVLPTGTDPVPAVGLGPSLTALFARGGAV